MATWSERITRQMQAKQRICGACGKVYYDSEAEAGRVIRDYHARMRRRPYYLRGESPALVPKRAYFDEKCRTWHVTKHRAPRRSAVAPSVDRARAPRALLELPPPPAVSPRTRPTEYLEALTLSWRDEIRRQGGGLRLPPRKAVEHHYMGVSWPLIALARDLLTETGWLCRMPDANEMCLVTVGRSFAEASRVNPASLSA